MTIKTVTFYVAADGTEFTDPKKCKQYEADGCVELFPLPKFGEHVPLTDEALRWLCGGDGDCYYATAAKYSHKRPCTPPHPIWATHLIYFGK